MAIVMNESTPRKIGIELSIDGRKAIYDDITGTVTYFTKNGVSIDCEVPRDFALTRTFQFMESLLRADLI